MARSEERPSTPWAEAACLLAGAATPLVFHTFGTVGYEATKAVLVRCLALILALGWLSARTAILTGRAGGPGGLDFGGAAGRPFVLAVAGFALSLAVSTALSIQPLVSLLGSWDRVQGLVTVLAWVVLGIAAALAGRQVETRRALTTCWLLASVPVCLYALAQRAQLDPVTWLNQPLGATSTLGSSTALATYLAMLLPLSLARAVEAGRALLQRRGADDDDEVDRRERRRRVRRERDARGPFGVDRATYLLAGWSGLVALQVAALVATHVRGGVLGAAIGLLVGVVALMWRLRPSWRRPTSALGLVVGVAASALLLGGAAATGVDGTDSAGQRFLIWRATLETVATGGWRALLGFGPETQAVALEPRFPIELATHFEDLRYDRAHNLLLDTLLTTGLVGLMALAALGALVVRSGLRALHTGSHDAATQTAGLLGALAAYFVANGVAFDSNATGVLGAMIAGLLVAPSLRPPMARGVATQRRERQPETRPLVPLARLRVTGWLAAAAVGAALLPWLLAPLMADLYHTRALAMRAAEAPASSVVQEWEATSWAPWQDVPLLATALAYEESARTTSNATGPIATTFDDLATQTPTSREAQFQAARLSLERAASINPRDPYPYAYLGRLWATWAEATSDPAIRADRLGRAVEAYDRAIERGPHRPRFYDEAGEVLTAWGRPDFAIARYQQAEALTRPTAERLARLGDVERDRGDRAAARDWYARALALNDRSAPASAGLAQLDREAGDLASAVRHAERAARSQMRNWVYHRDLALIYRDAGQRDEALVEARSARRYAPAWKQDELTDLVDALR